jgi:uncharacterized membrane protein
MARLKALWLDMVDSLWLVPALLTLAAGGLAVLLVNTNDLILRGLDPTTRWWAFGGSAEGAAGVLSAIASGIITVTGVVFSVTIVALQLASSQFTPRVLRQFTADRANQVVLGVFIGTFTYTLLVQRTLRSGNGAPEFVPNIAVTGAVILALVSIGFLIFFINHAARSIQASVIIDTVTEDTLAAIRDIFPDAAEPDGDALLSADELMAGRRDAPRSVAVRKAGYIQSIDEESLARIARQRQLLVRMEVEVGKYVLPGEEVMSVWPADDVHGDAEAALRDALVLGLERTKHRDPKFGVIELMDIAVKAMSPSVNDPTTALNAIDRLGEILLEFAHRRRGDRMETSPDGRPLLIIRRPQLHDTVGIAFDQIRHFASGNPTVAIAMVRLLGRLARLSPPASHDEFVRHLHAVRHAAEARITDSEDRRRFDSAVADALRTAAAR